MKIVIMTKDTFLVQARTKYNEFPCTRYIRLYHNLKIDNWEDFIEYIKQYKKIKENENVY